jgi:hypothetical protein
VFYRTNKNIINNNHASISTLNDQKQEVAVSHGPELLTKSVTKETSQLEMSWLNA